MLTCMNKNDDRKKNGGSLLRSGILLSVMTFASRIMGLVREMTKASFLGTTMYADAFTTSFMIPNLLRRLFAENSISVAFIPTFKAYLEKGGSESNRKETQEFLAATFTLVSFAAACTVVIGILITPLLTPLFCSRPDAASAGYAAEFAAWLAKKNEITVLTRIMFPYLLLISVAAFFQGILNGCGIFSPSGFTPVLFNGTVIAATYALAPHTENPARAMAIGVVLGGTVQALFQLPFVLKTGWKVSFTGLRKTFSNPGTKKVLALIGPTVIGMAAYQLNDVVSTALANKAGEGIAASLQYSMRLQELILGIFAVSIGTVILPDLSGLAARRDWEKFNTMLIQAIRIITVITIPVTFYSLVNGKELISLLYKSKKFNEESVLLTLGEFRWHIAGLFFIAVNRIISPAFYAQGNTKLPTTAGIISFGANILLALALAVPMGGNGIALALSLASMVNTVFLFMFMGKMNSMDTAKILRSTLLYIARITLFSVAAAVPCFFLRPQLTGLFGGKSRLIAQGAPAAVSALVFAAIGISLLVVTKDPALGALAGKIRSHKTK